MWTQVYDPTPWTAVSTILAALPVLILLGLLATNRAPAHLAALFGLISAFLIAVFFYVPRDISAAGYLDRVAQWLPTVCSAAGYGAAFGLLPIGWIVFNAIFLYALTVDTGQFEIVKHSVAAISKDRRIQAMLIAFCFGAFIEGAAGFGTPVAISAALMMGAGFKPLYAAGLALLANTSPVAFGALGTPILTLGRVTDLDPNLLSAMAGRQLPFFSLIIPVWLVWVMSGFRGVIGVWPALLICGGSFAAVQFAVANYIGPHLVDVAGGLVSMIALSVFLRFWQPRDHWRFAHEDDGPEGDASADGSDTLTQNYTTSQIVSAWLPWVLLSLLVFLWGIPQVKQWLDNPFGSEPSAGTPEAVSLRPTVVAVEVPYLHNRVARDAPVVPVRKVEEARYRFNWLSTTGTSIFIAAILSALWLRISPLRFIRIFLRTLYRVRLALLTIACMLAIAFVTRFSGMDASLGLTMAGTGALYPLFASMLGWLGVALTGSDTSSNALFGSLQTITAGKLVEQGVLPLSDMQAKVLLATANSTGGVMGKMIDAQSIVVASTATGQTGQEGAILRFVFLHSIVLAFLMGLLVLFQAYVWHAAIPV